MMKLEDLYQLFLKYSNITTDSRVVTKNALFFALKGESFDGNAYASKALENGCSYAIIDNQKYAISEKYILVNDVLETLQKLGNLHRKKLNVPIIAITGTNGKTTTKELIAAALSKKYSITFTQGNLNNHIGVPLTLLSMTQSTDMGIVEMGANHTHEIMALCNIAEPNYGIITNIGKAHLEGFGSFENIIKTKKELYDYLSKAEGKVFYNSKNKLLSRLINEMELETISYNGVDSKVTGELNFSGQFLAMKVKIGEQTYDLNTKLVGAYNFENVMAAMAIGEYFNVPTKLLKEAIEEYLPQNNRSQFIQTKINNIFLDAYNANPSSVELSLKNFVSLNKPNSCIILGDMLELGKEAENEHKRIIQLLKNNSFSKVILVGAVYNSLGVDDEMLQFENVNELKKWLVKNKIENSNVLIKGSRGIQLETIVEYL